MDTSTENGDGEETVVDFSELDRCVQEWLDKANDDGQDERRAREQKTTTHIAKNME